TQNSSDAVEQNKEAHGMGDVGSAEDVKEAPSPEQGYVWTHSKHQQQASPYLNKNNQLFHDVLHNMNPEEPSPTRSEAEQRLNMNPHFPYNLSADTAANSTLESVAEDEGSPAAPELLPTLQTPETHWKRPKEGPDPLSEARSSDSPEDTLLEEDLSETKVRQHLRPLVPNKALQVFLAGVTRALQVDCTLPQLQPLCAKLLTRTGLLVKLVSGEEASSLAGRCHLQENISMSMAQGSTASSNLPGKGKAQHISGKRLLLVLLVSLIVTTSIVVICLIKVCCRKPAGSSQPQRTGKSQRRWFFQKLLPLRWQRNKPHPRKQGSHSSNQTKTKPQWLREVYLPLNDLQNKLYEDDSWDEEEEEIFNKFEPM
ncbi:L37A2 protein, partial [Alectura lathami]|nr:L37A2 protein [Alectura lathami]